MALAATAEPTTAAEVMARVKRTRGYFAALGAPAAQLGKELNEVKLELELVKQENYELKARLAEHEIPEAGRGVSVSDVQKAVCRHFNIARVDLVSQRKTTGVVYPRQIAMYLSKTLTLHSYPEIGRRFGGRNHTTVLHAVRKIAFDRESNPTLEDVIQLITRTILEFTSHDDAHKSQA
jgi:chromosomal replication initiation ATPase DnaA